MARHVARCDVSIILFYILSASLGVTRPACHAGNRAASSEASRAMPTIRPSSLQGTLKIRPVWNCSKKSTAKMFCENQAQNDSQHAAYEAHKEGFAKEGRLKSGGGDSPARATCRFAGGVRSLLSCR